MAGGAKKGGDNASLAVLGVPMNCSGEGRCEQGPAAIRDALAHYGLHDSDAGIDLGSVPVRDFGDIALVGNSAEGNFFRCVETMRRAHVGESTILLGGDNAITRPGLHSLGFPLERCGLLTFGAQNDLGELEHGLTSSNAVSALLRDGLPGTNIVQIGIQPFIASARNARTAHEAGIEVVTVDQVHAQGIEHVTRDALARLTSRVDAIYVNLDLDVLDRAYAPGCAGSRPGGLPPWMMRQAARVCGRDKRVLIMDIVALDPKKDINSVTAMAAASFLLAFAAGGAALARA